MAIACENPNQESERPISQFTARKIAADQLPQRGMIARREYEYRFVRSMTSPHCRKVVGPEIANGTVPCRGLQLAGWRKAAGVGHVAVIVEDLLRTPVGPLEQAYFLV